MFKINIIKTCVTASCLGKKYMYLPYLSSGGITLSKPSFYRHRAGKNCIKYLFPLIKTKLTTANFVHTIVGQVYWGFLVLSQSCFIESPD